MFKHEMGADLGVLTLHSLLPWTPSYMMETQSHDTWGADGKEAVESLSKSQKTKNDTHLFTT